MLFCMMGTSSAWADEVTYTFTSKSWTATSGGSAANWTSGKDGGGFSNNGIQVTASGTGANGTSPVSFTNISEIVLTYNTNTSKGAGSAVVKIGDNDAVSQNWGYSTGNGTSANYTLTYSYETPQSGNVKITLNTTTNSIYLVSCKITYNTSGGGDTPTLDDNDLALTGAPVELEFDLYNNASAQVINYTTSSTGAISIDDSDYATFDIDEENKTITVTPTAVTPNVVTITVNQAADDSYKAGSTTFDLLVDDSTPIPTHTATFSVNGVTSTQDFEEGADIIFPADPADVSGKTFVGWVAEAIEGTTNDAPTFVTSATMGQSDITYYAVFAYASGSGSSEVVDVLNREWTGVSGTNYANWTGKTATSSAVYAGNSAGGNDCIQLRSNNSNSGVVTTTSGGKAKKVVISWYSGTTAGRTVSIYGNNTAYTAATDLYSSTMQGTLLGELNIDNASNYVSEFNITDDIEYIGIRSKSGALYFAEVEITWSTGSGASYSDYCTTVVADSKKDAELSFAVTEVNANISDAFEAPTLNAAEGFNGTVEYESSDETVAQIMDTETGELRLLKGGTTTITATFAGNDDFRPGSASYTLTVTDNRIATTITVEDIVLDLSDVATLTQLNPVVKDADNNIIDCTYEDFPPKVSYEIVSDASSLIGSLDNNSGEITLNPAVGTATLKAYYNAFNVSNTYKPSECTFTITVESVQTISEARAQGTGSVTTKGIVTSCSGTTAYIQDADAAICVYGSALTVGDEVKVSGTLTTYNGLLEITSPTVTVLSQDNTVTPEVMTIAEINESDNQGWLVKIEDATVTAISGQNTTIAQGDNTIVVRGISGGIAVDDVITLTGNIGCYKDAAQIANPTDVAVKVAAPTFDPEAGEVAAGTTVTISTTTEDATIYYTTNGEEPTTESAEYTEPITINEGMTIKAIAVKDGMANSSVATATYTINTTPFITVAQTEVNVEAAGDEGSIEVTYNNMPQDEFVADVVYCDAEGNDASYDWFIASINDETNNIDYLVSENTSTEARTAYIKVYAIYDDDYFSDIITFTQAGMVVDYATLPFAWDDKTAPTGVTTSGTGTYNGSPYIKFDSTDDYMVLKINEVPGTLSFDIKGNSFSDGTFTVQTSADGTSYSALQTYTELGATQTEQFELAADVRYIKWIYTEKVNGNVALGNINLTKDVNITVSAAGYATYCSDKALDFSHTPDMKAYIVTSDGSETNYTEVTSAPANTGLLLKGTKGEATNFTAYVIGNSDTDVTDNKLVGVTTATQIEATAGGKTNFVLQNQEAYGVGFYKVTGEGFNVRANSAYLSVELSSGSEARSFFALPEDGSETTGINSIDNGQLTIDNEAVYDLQGRKVQNPKRGLYIMNGKKVMVK